MKKEFLSAVLICLFALPLAVNGQILWKILKWEAGVGLGSVHSFTDIGPAHNTSLNFFNGTRPNLILDFRYKMTPAMAVKLDLGYLMFGGADVDQDTHYRPDYNYAYTTHSFEHTLRYEYYIFGESRRRTSNAIYSRRGMLNDFSRVYLYLFAGAGGILTKARVYEKGNPDNELTGIAGYDNNLLWNPVFPGGIGVKYSYTQRWLIGVEFGLRYLLNDFLDGYSDPYYSEHDDYYYLFSVKMIYRIRAGRNGLPTFKRYMY